MHSRNGRIFHPRQKNKQVGKLYRTYKLPASYTFLKVPWNYSFFYFTPGNSRKNKAPPLNIPKHCVRSLEISPRPKTKQDPSGKFHIHFFGFFLVNLGNSNSFLINPWKALNKRISEWARFLNLVKRFQSFSAQKNGFF